MSPTLRPNIQPPATDPQLEALGTGPQFVRQTTRAEDGSLRDFYTENVYLVVTDALSAQELDELRAEATSICRGERGEIEGFVPGVEGESEEETLRRYLCIHFPHKLSQTMLDYLSTPSIVKVLTEIIGPNVKCMQSMLFIKATGKPGQAWHQDEDFIPTRDNSLVGGWIALDDATIENGCLWVIPGSHKPGVLWPMQQQQGFWQVVEVGKGKGINDAGGLKFRPPAVRYSSRFLGRWRVGDGDGKRGKLIAQNSEDWLFEHAGQEILASS